MKKLLTIFLLLLPILAFPQGTPQGISYQAVAYDSEGFELSNQDISVRLGILLGGVDAEASYTEVHSVTTDDFGLFSLVISQGETSNTFSSINWEEGAYLRVEVDEDLDGEYSVMGVSSFNAVPYALSAPTSNDILSRLNELENKIDSLENRVKVGDYAHGGIVFYVDETGEHGLVAAEYDIDGVYEFGCSENNPDFALGYDIGSGFLNTLEMIEADCQPTNNYSEISAAFACDIFESNGFSDWYIPSLYEMRMIYEHLMSDLYIENFNTNNPILYNFTFGMYWTSTIYPSNSISWAYLFQPLSSQPDFIGATGRTNPGHIRPVRSF